MQEKNYIFKLSNDLGNALYFGYNVSQNVFFVDRKKSGEVQFSDKFVDTFIIAPRSSKSKTLTGLVLIDKTSIELFFDGGSTVMTNIFFPQKPFQNLYVGEQGENIFIDNFELTEIKP